MAINVFEGGRRVLHLLVGVWLLGWIIAAFVNEPILSRMYVVDRPGSYPVLYSADDCNWQDRREYKRVRTPRGRPLDVSICFKAMTSTDGTSFIPTENEAGGRIKGWDQYSSEARAYTESVANRFSPPTADIAAVDDRYWQERILQMKFGALVAVLGVFTIYVTAYVLGWILRGFLGIPRGSDTRSDHTTRH